MALTDSAKETVEYMFSLTPKPGKAALYGCAKTVTRQQIADDFDDYADILGPKPSLTTDHDKLIITLGTPTENASRYTKIHEKTMTEVVAHPSRSATLTEMAGLTEKAAQAEADSSG